MSGMPAGLPLRRLLPGLRSWSRDRLGSSVALDKDLAPPVDQRWTLNASDASFDYLALRRRRWFDLDRWFGLTLIVVLPTLIAIVYYGLLAADRFVSESEFVLRSPAALSTSGFSALLAAQGGVAAASGLTIGGDSDAEAIAAYIDSLDAMAAVDRVLDLPKVFARPEADWFARYPAVLRSETNYSLHRYYQDMISVDYNPTTAIIKLTVEAFRPEDAQAIGEALIGDAESLANRMDARRRQDAIKAATDQVESARAQVITAQRNLTELRLREQMIDPVKMSGVIIETIGKLLVQSIDAKSRLSDLLNNTPNNQQASVLRGQIASLEDQIATQQRRLAGPDGSLSPILAEYARLSLLSEFANQIHAASLEQLEAARAEAARQRAFVERISGPTLTDFSTQPRRGLMVILVFAVTLSAWVVLRFAMRDSRMHHGR